MPTNRPFFANFLAAFRAHSNPTYKASSSSQSPVTSPTGLAANAHVSTTTTTVTSSSPRSITTKTAASSSTPTTTTTTLTPPATNPSSSISTAAVTAANAASSGHHLHAQPLSRSPGVSTPLGPHNMSMSPPGASTPINRGRQRRGSDSSNSSGGFMDELGPEKWYIGGRKDGGEEKFYRLTMVTSSPGRRVRSLDRLSL